MAAIAFSQTISAVRQNGVLVVTIDNPPVNATSADVRARLMAALDHAADDRDIIGLVITGAGRTFVGGADIKEFGKPPQPPFLPDVYGRIEQFAKPIVAAINGAALGGGCELVLACHARIASPSASLGLPEVKLGLVPGAGGTQRLPRLIGLAAASDLIGTGRAVKADEALRSGLVDRIATADLVAEAVEVVRSLAGSRLCRTGELSVPPSDPEEMKAVAGKILGRARGRTAPGEALRLVELAASLPLAEGLAEERAVFLRLRDSREAAALRHVFFAERAVAKVEGLEKVEARKVEIIGIVGTGLMGSGIAVAALGAGYRVICVEQATEAAAKGRERIGEMLDRLVQSGRLDMTARDEQFGRLVVAADLNALVSADLVIEAVFDDLDVKVALFRQLDTIVSPQATLLTNTSYLDPDVIAAATAHPARVAGLHFFSPANIMRLVEVVDCAETSPEVLATVLAFAKRLGKLPVICGVTEGFIGNRVFSAYRREAEFMLEDGAMPHEIDAAMEAFGFPMGLFAVNDMAGLEIAWARRKRQASTRDPAARYVAIADRLCEAGRLGRKAGRGWYAYADAKRVVDSEVSDIIEAARAEKNIVPRAFDGQEIMARLLGAMAAEGSALLAENIAARASDIDIVMINGYGFPAHKGGPMFLAGEPR